ncbi:MAG TPA: hypothetical protein VI566_01790 [Xanthomonadales bacterium]|nr:hypothetical protein [Xanthomonadales bacterium]
MNYSFSSKLFLPILTATLALLLVSTCEARTKVVDKWINEEAPETQPQKIALIAVLPDGLVREAVEIGVVGELKKKGREVIVGSKLPGMYGGIRGKINTKKATEALIKAGMDGVIVMFYTGGGVSDEYARSDYWAEYVGSTVGWGGYSWGTPYFTDVYVVHKGEGYSDFTRSATVESSYYDLKSKQPVWRLVTLTKDLEHSDAAKQIGKKIASQMKASGL